MQWSSLGRRRFLGLVASAATAPWAKLALAQPKYPQSTVKIIVPTTPGGAVDAFGRGVGRRLEQSFGITAIVENKAGANGAIGAEAVASAPANGANLLVIFPSHVLNPLFTKNLPYRPFEDFTPVIWIGNIPLILVTQPDFPANSVQELIALAKAKPGSLSFASGGVGSGGHLSGELFKYLTKADLQHVLYRGNAPALNDVLGGHVSMMFDTITTGLQHVKAGKLKLLAVSSRQRSPLAPEAPTMIEAGVPNFETNAWYGLLAPAGTPRELVQMLNTDLNQAFADASFRDQFAAQGVQFVGGTPEEFGASMHAEAKRWAEVIESTGMKPQ